jgi:hypothetical protein
MCKGERFEWVSTVLVTKGLGVKGVGIDEVKLRNQITPKTTRKLHMRDRS